MFISLLHRIGFCNIVVSMLCFDINIYLPAILCISTRCHLANCCCLDFYCAIVPLIPTHCGQCSSPLRFWSITWRHLPHCLARVGPLFYSPSGGDSGHISALVSLTLCHWSPPPVFQLGAQKAAARVSVAQWHGMWPRPWTGLCRGTQWGCSDALSGRWPPPGTSSLPLQSLIAIGPI